jgi:small conductance mechanosensitive channel
MLRLASPLLSLLLLCCVSFAALADTGRATVRLDGRALFQVSGDSREEARERADEIERRFIRILESPAGASPASITVEGDVRVLATGTRFLLNVTPEDAADHGVSVAELAMDWKEVVDSALVRAGERRVSRWGRISAETQASVNTSMARMAESAITFVPRLLASLLVILLFWGLAATVRWLMHRLFHRVGSDPTIENLTKQIAYYFVWAIGIVVATSALGFDPQALATALGLTGVALGFALKDILSNFVSGILILIMRPFEIGDQIVVGETEGSVERIHLRATQIRTYDGRAVLVPNGEVFTSRVTNNTESPVRRGAVLVHLGYDVNLPEALARIAEATRGARGVLAQPPVVVEVRELEKTNVVVESRFWADSRRTDFVSTASAVRKSIVTELHSEVGNLPGAAVRILEPKRPS